MDVEVSQHFVRALSRSLRCTLGICHVDRDIFSPNSVDTLRGSYVPRAFSHMVVTFRDRCEGNLVFSCFKVDFS